MLIYIRRPLAGNKKQKREQYANRNTKIDKDKMHCTHVRLKVITVLLYLEPLLEMSLKDGIYIGHSSISFFLMTAQFF